ncbi:hypothetical protein X975_01170, partial [Stegodyphus mimosarum]
MDFCECVVSVWQEEHSKYIASRKVSRVVGDASMEHLWKDGQGLVYKETLSWLKSSDENLLIAGALAA